MSSALFVDSDVNAAAYLDGDLYMAQATGDPALDRYPLSVKPDNPIAVRTLMNNMRDDYQGTQFDLTEHPAFGIGKM